ncbi:MAG: peptidylprolyl isomerase [bacterium]|nr:peptidylprolyl isomerase [bacterium]
MDKKFSGKIKWIAVISGVAITVVAASFIAIGQDKEDKAKAGVTAGEPAAKEIVAEVNGKKITVSEFNAQLERIAGNEPTQADNPMLKQKLLDGMVKEALIMQEAEKLGVEKDPEVQKSLEQAKQQILVRAVVEKEVIDKVKSVDEKELKSFYEENKAQFQTGEKVRARHILVKTKAEADQIKVQLDKGADFAKLAKEKSLDTGTKENGGDLGFFGKGEMVPEFENAAFSLSTGKISPPVKSQFGYHIIKVEEKKPSAPLSFEEAKPYIERRLINQKQRERLELWLAELEKSAKITTYPERIGLVGTGAPKPAESEKK